MANVAAKKIAIIPARGGSKRLPKKNILTINDRPMISYPIRVAQESGLFDDVVVSTEDEEIAEIARSCNATVSRRPENLAQDSSTVVQVCAELLSRDEYQEIEIFCCIYATAIFLSQDDLLRSGEILTGEVAVDFVMGVSEYNYHPVQALREEGGYLRSMWPEFNEAQSQSYPCLVVSNGTLYWARKKAFLRDLSFYGKRLKGYQIAGDHSIDIDTADDYRRAQEMAKKRL